jgi:hypothetical protein
MFQIQKINLFIGSIQDLYQINEQEWAVIHATQSIHYSIFGWNRTSNKPDKNHPNYIFYEKENRLSLNWVDGPANLYDWSGVETFIKVLNFVDKWILDKNVLIHCDQGQSRAPTLALLYLAKRIKTISNDSFQKAKNDFIQIYPYYVPGGIGEYIQNNWNSIV